VLARSEDYRKNEMVMLEEFRRRKKMKDYFDLMKKRGIQEQDKDGHDTPNHMDFDTAAVNRDKHITGTGPERFFRSRSDEVFSTAHFTLIFIDSDSVTNVTRLNRINHRRVLLFIGNADGIISYGKGKGEDYEGAFEHAFKKLRQNLICLPMDRHSPVNTRLEGRHNDFYIKIWPQLRANYWGNPYIWKMLLYSGFTNVRFMCKSRKRDPYSLIYAFFNAVTQN
jgi:small subunit ribosomal protein S5